MPTFRDASAGLQEADRGPGAVPIRIEIVNSGCSLFEADSLEIYDDSPNGTSNLLMSIGSFGLESGGEWVIHQEFILTDPGEHQIRVVAVREGVTSHLLVESDSDDITFQSETRDYFSIHVSGSETVPTQPSQIQPVDIEPDGSGPVTTSTTNTIPSAPSPTEVVGCDMVWDGQKWVVESC